MGPLELLVDEASASKRQHEHHAAHPDPERAAKRPGSGKIRQTLSAKTLQLYRSKESQQGTCDDELAECAAIAVEQDR